MRRSHQFDPSMLDLERALRNRPIITANPTSISSVSLVTPLILLFVVLLLVIIGLKLLQLGTILR